MRKGKGKHRWEKREREEKQEVGRGLEEKRIRGEMGMKRRRER